MKHVADLCTEELEALLLVNRKKVKELEVLLAKRAQESDATSYEPARTLPCRVCCLHVWRNRATGPRDNGEKDLVCEKCGLEY